LIRWVIQQHPDIRLDGHLEQGLSIGTADKTAYGEMRELWLKQLARFPNNAQVLSNAAHNLALTDREAALSWLKHARDLNPLDGSIQVRMSDLYAEAIVGISETGPDLIPSAIDLSEAHSTFANMAYEEAGRDSTLASWTGMRLHASTNFLHYIKLSQQNYDLLAESLFLKAADLDYPNPTRMSVLRDFYRDQRAKSSGGIEPKAEVVDRSNADISRRITGDTGTSLQSRRQDRSAVPVKVEIVIGIDGHVWSAHAEEPASGQNALMAQFKAEQLTYRPLRLNGRPVQIRTIVTAMVDELTPRK
jgi:hypothetical protein